MRKNKFVYTLSALMMACIISFSGVGGSYIQAEATSVGITPGVWNDDVSAWENIRHYLELFAAAWDIYVSPNVSTVLWGVDAHNDFYNFMVADDYTEEEAEECVHGGGGHVRDGISVDDDGNVTYSDDVSDLFHDYICNYLETESGYWVVETISAAEFVDNYYYGTQANFKDEFIKTVDNLGGLISCQLSNNYDASTGLQTGTEYLFFRSFDSSDFVLSSGTSFNKNSDLGFILNGVVCKFHSLTEDTSHYDQDFYNYGSFSALTSSALDCKKTYQNYHPFFSEYLNNSTNPTLKIISAIVSSDGRLIKIWRSVADFTNYNRNQQPYYYTQNWVNYDASQDNSITMTSAEYSYYNDNSTTIYQTIQNNIDNSGSDLTEEDIQKIVDDAIKEIKDSISNDSGDGSVSDNDSGNGGIGVSDLIEGIGKIFDTILSLIGKLMGVVADFTQSILDLFSGFTTFTDGFSDFLAGAFGFIPPEIWDIVKVGMSLMVLLAVIKFLRK